MFADRHDAGRRLAAQLEPFAADRPVVVALPRGGVPVAAEVAHALRAPLDVLAVRKLGAPRRPEVGVGAIAEGGSLVLDATRAAAFGMTQRLLEQTVEREAAELTRRITTYRGGRPAPSLAGRTVLVVDDGFATGLTDLAGVRTVRSRGAARVVVAAPVGSRSAVARLAEEADEVVCVTIPHDLRSVGEWYADFEQVDDRAVVAALRAADRRSTRDGGRATRGSSVVFALPHGALQGELDVPADARCLVVFAAGTASSRHSPTSRAVAEALQARGVATLLVDLLTEDEVGDHHAALDVPLLASRLESIARWSSQEPHVAALPLVLFGVSTGAAAALRAAAELGHAVSAVVSRDGRPDLAADRLPYVTAPTLMLVTRGDEEALERHRHAAAELRCAHELVALPATRHLVVEPGALEAVADLVEEWIAGDVVAPSVPGVERRL